MRLAGSKSPRREYGFSAGVRGSAEPGPLTYSLNLTTCPSVSPSQVSGSISLICKNDIVLLSPECLKPELRTCKSYVQNTMEPYTNKHMASSQRPVIQIVQSARDTLTWIGWFITPSLINQPSNYHRAQPVTAKHCITHINTPRTISHTSQVPYLCSQSNILYTKIQYIISQAACHISQVP